MIATASTLPSLPAVPGRFPSGLAARRASAPPCVVPLPAVLDEAGAAVVVLLAAGGRRVVLDASELREVHPGARQVLEELAGTGARVTNLSPALRAVLAESPALALAARAPEDETLFLCPDREEDAPGFLPSRR
jgi:hypothetical protein